MRILFLLFVIMPILEIALLVHVGGLIGGWNTVAIVVVTAFVGAFLVKQEGMLTLQRAQEKMQRNEMPGQEMVEGLMLLISGVLLVTPGFITDIFGFLLAFPLTRKAIAKGAGKAIIANVVVRQGQSGFHQGPFTNQPHDQSHHHTRAQNGDVFEGEYQDKTETDENRRIR